MEYLEFRKKFEDLTSRYERAYDNDDKELMKQIEDEQRKLLESECNAIIVWFTHLDEKLCPAPELVGECKHGKNGLCSECDNFVCYDTHGEEIFEFRTYDAFCFKADLTELKGGDK